jgi:hypothetical protein
MQRIASAPSAGNSSGCGAPGAFLIAAEGARRSFEETAGISVRLHPGQWHLFCESREVEGGDFRHDEVPEAAPFRRQKARSPQIRVSISSTMLWIISELSYGVWR